MGKKSRIEKGQILAALNTNLFTESQYKAKAVKSKLRIEKKQALTAMNANVLAERDENAKAIDKLESMITELASKDFLDYC